MSILYSETLSEQEKEFQIEKNEIWRGQPYCDNLKLHLHSIGSESINTSEFYSFENKFSHFSYEILRKRNVVWSLQSFKFI